VNICDFGGCGAICAPVMEAAEEHEISNVEMVADEVCCWLPNNGD
jgi:hypothetical protein